MSLQYIRRAQLNVAGTVIELTGAEDARDDTALRVRFTIKAWTLQTPRTAEIRITNLNPDTAKRLMGQKGKTVELNAGYRESMGRIFKGEIKQVRKGRETPTDTYLDVFAATQDRAYNNAIVNKTLPAGSTGQDIYKACLEAMKPFGVTQGQIPDALAKMKYPRPVTLFGMARDHLRTLAYSSGCTWNIRDDNLDVIPKDGALTGGAIILNSRTGLIGLPAQTEQGILARCLINTRIGVNSMVKIDQSSIQSAVQPLSIPGEPRGGQPFIAPIDVDGLYRVVAVDHIGDTRGQPWYCDLYCTAKSASGSTVTQAQLGWN
jgi:hypothetical protein